MLASVRGATERQGMFYPKGGSSKPGQQVNSCNSITLGIAQKLKIMRQTDNGNSNISEKTQISLLSFCGLVRVFSDAVGSLKTRLHKNCDLYAYANCAVEMSKIAICKGNPATVSVAEVPFSHFFKVETHE